jgi:hypothetical protein
MSCLNCFWSLQFLVITIEVVSSHLAVVDFNLAHGAICPLKILASLLQKHDVRLPRFNICILQRIHD